MSDRGHREGTVELAKALCASIGGDPRQSAAVLAALAACATISPVAALASGVAGAALLALRPRDEGLDVFGRDREEVARMRRGFTMTIGHEWKTKRPLTMSSDDLRQHALVLGTTGSGKTEFLLGLSEAAIASGAGLLFVDGKGDVSLFAKAYTIARRHGRIDDLLVLNLMGASHLAKAQPDLLFSNTFNPFARGSADALTQVVVGLMDEVGRDGAVWKGQATVLFTGLMQALVWLRDQGRIDLDAASILGHLNFGAIVHLASGASHPDIPQDIRKSLSRYLESLPAYNPERGTTQARAVLDHHGYLEMIFTSALGKFSSVYDHVFANATSHVDMQDVLLNRRILLVLLPALEKCGDEKADLGKIVLASLKSLMLSALGNRIEWDTGEILDNRVTNAQTPFFCILDEIGYYITDGLALVAAQARSLGFAMVYAAPDIPSMRRLNEREAASIIANTNLKVFMKTDEPSSHREGDLVIRRGTGSNFHVLDTFTRSMTAEADLTEFGAGDMLVLWKSCKVWARCVHPGPYGSGKAGAAGPVLRPNHFLRLPPVASAEVR